MKIMYRVSESVSKKKRRVCFGSTTIVIHEFATYGANYYFRTPEAAARAFVEFQTNITPIPIGDHTLFHDSLFEE